MKSVTAFAPASVGNVAVGFDVLGHAIEGVGDEVVLTSTDCDRIEVTLVGDVCPDLPLDPELNTAGRPLLEMRRDFGIRTGVTVSLHKGIPLGSGMGGSAASAVAAVVAADELWSLGLGWQQLLTYALLGESVASGEAHPDNAAPSLIGGLVLCELVDERFHMTHLPVPGDLRCVLVHPDHRVDTRGARDLLANDVPLADFVSQSRFLAGFVAGCCRGDTAQIARCLRDIVIEPQRARNIPAFSQVRSAALGAGAVGVSISGSGPSVFAWCRDANAEQVAQAMRGAFEQADVDCQHWISRIDVPGARITTRS